MEETLTSWKRQLHDSVFLHSFAGQLLKIQALLKAHFLMKYQMLLRIGYISRINPTGLVAIYFQLSPSSLEDGLISRRVKFVSLWLPFKGKLFLIKSKQEISRAMAALLKRFECSHSAVALGGIRGQMWCLLTIVFWNSLVSNGKKARCWLDLFVCLSSNAQPARRPLPPTFEAHSHC